MKNNIKYINQLPTLLQDWNDEKNTILPNLVKTNSKEKYWWKCRNGHEWKTTVSKKYNIGCIYCLCRTDDTNKVIISVAPSLVNEWDYEKNKGSTPSDISAYSNKKAWWKCRENHSWDAVIGSRVKGAGCPYCSGLRLLTENSLMVKNPELAKEWHPTKNGDKKPKDVSKSLGRKVWWKCKLGHEWEASINNRSKGRGCPFCRGKKSSKSQT